MSYQFWNIQANNTACYRIYALPLFKKCSPNGLHWRSPNFRRVYSLAKLYHMLEMKYMHYQQLQNQFVRGPYAMQFKNVERRQADMAT